MRKQFVFLMLVTIVAFIFVSIKQKQSNRIEIVSVYDGDTIFVNVSDWPDIIGKRIGVRLRGIDCPEIDDERRSVNDLAKEARQ
jgi:endonuclease YncB( thermonuclease family)